MYRPQPAYSLFDCEEPITREKYALTPESEQDAATILEDLLRTKQPDAVNFIEVVRRKMDPLNTWGEGIPEDSVEVFAEQLRAVRGSRTHLKNLVEARGEFPQLALIGQDRLPAERSNGTLSQRLWGFIPRHTEIGQQSDRVQVHMSVAKVEKIVHREVISGVLTEQKAQHALSGLGAIKETFLHQEHSPEQKQIEFGHDDEGTL